ncbi:MAG: hypothetical protein GY861_04140 [bacterium]|nr:hypothetical protein [bacterium]
MNVNNNDHIETLIRWKEQLEKEHIVLRNRYSEIAEELSKKDAQLKNVVSLLESEGWMENGRLPSLAGGENSVGDAACAVLLELGHPVYYKEIANTLMSNGVFIPGKDPAANLLAHINRDERFSRVGRGIYALDEWGLQKESRSKSKRSRSRKKQTKKKAK